MFVKSPGYSHCTKEVFTSFGRSFDYCEFAFGKYANLSGIFTHEQIAKGLRLAEQKGLPSPMDECYSNEGDSHFKQYCQDIFAYGYIQNSTKTYHSCLQSYFSKQDDSSSGTDKSHMITQADLDAVRKADNCKLKTTVDARYECFAQAGLNISKSDAQYCDDKFREKSSFNTTKCLMNSMKAGDVLMEKMRGSWQLDINLVGSLYYIDVGEGEQFHELLRLYNKTRPFEKKSVLECELGFRDLIASTIDPNN